MDGRWRGRAPVLGDLVFELIGGMRAEGRTMLVVEQNATRLLEVADRAYVLRTGEIAAEGAASDLLTREDLFDTFVGAARDSDTSESAQE